MGSVFEKLNLKDQREILIVNAPPEFEPELSQLAGVVIRRSAAAVAEISFCLAFVTKQREADASARAIAAKAKGDAVVWFAYPKGTSKRYKCDFNRDSGWAALGAAGFEGVRLVAIDEDWSAVRFRRVEFYQVHDPRSQVGNVVGREEEGRAEVDAAGIAGMSQEDTPRASSPALSGIVYLPLQ